MAEFFWTVTQCMCLLGYLYGAWLVIAHRACVDSAPTRDTRPSVARSDEDRVVWERYLACDS